MSSTNEEYVYNKEQPSISNDNNLLELALRPENIGKTKSNCQNTSQRSPSSIPYYFNLDNKEIRVEISEYSTSGCVYLSNKIEPYIKNAKSIDELIKGIGVIQQKFPPVIRKKYSDTLVSPILSVGINTNVNTIDSSDEDDY